MIIEIIAGESNIIPHIIFEFKRCAEQNGEMIPVFLLSLISFLIGLEVEKEDHVPIYFLKLDKKDYSKYDCSKYKYITKINIHEVDLNAVKHLSFDGFRNKGLPTEIRRFKKVERLDLSTDWTGMKVRWAGGLDEWVGCHKKSKLKEIPAWLVELPNMESINLSGHHRLEVESVAETLSKLEKLKSVTLEIEEKEIDHLDRLGGIKNLKDLTIYMEGMTRDNEIKMNTKLQMIGQVSISLKPVYRFEKKCFK